MGCPCPVGSTGDRDSRSRAGGAAQARQDGRKVVVELLVDDEPPDAVEVVVVSSTVVEVGGSVVLVVVGGGSVVVERTGGGAAVVVGRRAGSRVEVTPCTFFCGLVVTDSAATGGGIGCGVLGEAAGAVSNPSTLPPLAPSTTATVSAAHRRSTLYRTRAPVCAPHPDDKRIGWRRPHLESGSR
jgi:hypothetical protein